MNEAKSIADDPRTKESQRRARIEHVVQGIMSDLSDNGIHAGTVLDEMGLEYIAASLRAAISRSERTQRGGMGT